VSAVAKKQGTGAMSSLRILGERVKTLEAEKCSLLLEIEGLKKLAKSKVNDLESEVKVLREEVESFKMLLGAK
jgi:predicted  nucleic acid-binding Zn-ribbon protein